MPLPKVITDAMQGTLPEVDMNISVDDQSIVKTGIAAILVAIIILLIARIIK